MEGKRGRLLQILLIAVFILAIVFFGYNIFRGFQQYADSQVQVKAMQQAIHQQEKQLAELLAQPKTEQQMLDQLALLETLIPVSAEQDGIITGLSEAARIAGAALVSIQFTEDGRTDTPGTATQETNAYVSVPISCTFTGEYGSMLEVLNQLQFGNRLYRLDHLTLSRLDGSVQDLQMIVSGAYFYRNAQ